MKEQFGKRVTKAQSESEEHWFLHVLRWIFFLAAIVMLIAFLRAQEFVPFALMGMLGDPFRTTRKMRVPFKNRVGHRERNFIIFAKLTYVLCIGLLVVLVIVQAVSAVGVR